ncbi:gene transfer agent family protein [Phyllobacterium bourgognense]|uniref:Tail tube GTA-gp10-like protein n=1 Tax=Phyllobacterium bourgognense TaxID=314236 RepID=A0A368YZ27_9HYPH|nr:gene transfer agent family protein [Phyllobacterium bourgognense]RCW85431.1 tail tube GTA-gp10-like protein [Phyllobacterium bourgognense]
MTHKAFFGDKARTFALTPELIIELERKTGTGIAAFVARFMRVPMAFHFNDIVETIRLGLIGGGTSPEEAQSLVNAYVTPRPIAETLSLAIAILEAAWFGPAAPTVIAQDDIGHAAAIDDALNQVAP